MDQAFFGYAIPGILEEFNLPLEAAGIILTISFIVASIMLLFTGAAVDRFGRGPMLSLYLAVSALLVGLQGVAGGGDAHHFHAVSSLRHPPKFPDPTSEDLAR